MHDPPSRAKARPATFNENAARRSGGRVATQRAVVDRDRCAANDTLDVDAATLIGRIAGKGAAVYRKRCAACWECRKSVVEDAAACEGRVVSERAVIDRCRRRPTRGRRAE